MSTREAPDGPPALIYHGAGVLADEPVVRAAPLPTQVVPPSSRRRLAESAVLFLAAILFLRTTFVEPFGVPTGSMAPTLVGNHKALACPRCGYPVRVGDPGTKRGADPVVHCPNCGAADLPVAAAPEITGDRLLVDKNVFRLRSPRRWEVAVFICPSDRSKPYVKRVVGRPGEQIQLRDGDVWINGELARKSLAEARECRVPVFDVDYAPPGGWARRWLPDGVAPPIGSAPARPNPNWLTAEGGGLTVRADGSDTPRLVAYWHVSPDTLTAEVIRDGFEYNGHTTASHDYPVHDFLIEFEAEVLSGTGAVVCKMTDGADEATAQIAAGGEFGESKLLLPPKGLVRTANRPPLKPGRKYRVEMAFVDRRVSVAVEGREFFVWDLPPAEHRADVTCPFKIGGQGIDLAVRHVRLFRDVYYRPGDRHASTEPFQLGPDEYFLLGDNSANSDDSRSWQIPAVPERNFLGKPFLLHQPSRPAQWAVGGRQVDAQSIDWGRIRWLR
ncbi:MAG: signal peptidase I [Zavarzinella sp.]|nr:signal peptidase I [Zavarzinella sp.]